MKAANLKKKYTAGELADSFVFRNALSNKQKEEAARQLAAARKKNKEQLADEHILYAKVLQLRYRIEDYVESDDYNEELSFAYFLRQYIKLNYKVNKLFARDLNIDETELSQLLNRHRSPSEKTIIRLEIHSNSAIPALSWYKLLEKEKEHELQTDTKIRQQEEKFVRNRLVFSL